MMLGCCANSDSSLSAAGQMEQPCEVKSSKTTADCGAVSAADTLEGRMSKNKPRNLSCFALSKGSMRPITKRGPLGVLALAKGGTLGLIHFHFKRAKTAAGVRAIAPGLLFGFSATAPVVCSRLKLKHRGLLGGNDRFAHSTSPVYRRKT